MFWSIAKIIAVIFIVAAVAALIWRRGIGRRLDKRAAERGATGTAPRGDVAPQGWMLVAGAGGVGAAGVLMLVLSFANTA